MEDYIVTMLVKVQVYAISEADAIKQASTSHTFWDDWGPVDKSKIKAVKKYNETRN